MWSADRGINFIQQADEEEKPFMLWLTMPRPHQTYAAAKDFWDMYDEADINLAENSENTMEGRSSAAKEMQRRYKQEKDWMVFDPKEYEAGIKRVLRGYYACVTQMDDAMGKVLKSLDKMGIREDTIIVYLTDHGEFAGEHGMIEKAPGIGFGCVTRIPMIVSWKNHLPQNMVREELVEAVDVFPTVCGLADIDMPNWADGKNIVELLEADKPVRKYAITENPLTRTIHSKKYKLTQYLPEFEVNDFGE